MHFVGTSSDVSLHHRRCCVYRWILQFIDNPLNRLPLFFFHRWKISWMSLDKRDATKRGSIPSDLWTKSLLCFLVILPAIARSKSKVLRRLTMLQLICSLPGLHLARSNILAWELMRRHNEGWGRDPVYIPVSADSPRIADCKRPPCRCWCHVARSTPPPRCDESSPSAQWPAHEQSCSDEQSSGFIFRDAARILGFLGLKTEKPWRSWR